MKKLPSAAFFMRLNYHHHPTWQYQVFWIDLQILTTIPHHNLNRVHLTPLAGLRPKHLDCFLYNQVL